jgi:glucokinase
VLGAAKPFRSLLGVFWGTGVGGGIVLDGELYEGRGGAGEIGHMVVKSDGRKCPCGRIGCMEAYAGRGAMEAHAREKADKGEKTVLFEIMEEKGKPRLSSGIWERALERDDKLAHQLIKQAVEALGVGIASALNLLDVEAVVIGGGLGLRLGDPYVEKIREAVMPHLFADHRPPEILLASLGDLGGAVGATLLAADKTPAAA